MTDIPTTPPNTVNTDLTDVEEENLFDSDMEDKEENIQREDLKSRDTHV